MNLYDQVPNTNLIFCVPDQKYALASKTFHGSSFIVFADGVSIVYLLDIVAVVLPSPTIMF
jgi:hypothetical protein